MSHRPAAAVIQPEPPLADAERLADRGTGARPDGTNIRPLQPWSDEARHRNKRILTTRERVRRDKVARFQDHLADIVVRGDDDLDNPVAAGVIQLLWWGVVTIAINAAIWLMSWLDWDDSYVEVVAWLMLLAAALIFRATLKRWATWPLAPSWLTPRVHDPTTARLTTLGLRRPVSTSVHDTRPADVAVDDAV